MCKQARGVGGRLLSTLLLHGAYQTCSSCNEEVRLLALMRITKFGCHPHALFEAAAVDFFHAGSHVQVLDAESGGWTRLTDRVQRLWETADIGPGWVDLRPLKKLKSAQLHGIPNVWLPASLKSIDFTTRG